MQVSSQVHSNDSSTLPSQINPAQAKNLSNNEQESLKALKVVDVHYDSKQAQIDAYVAGTQEAAGTSDDYVQNYTDFASDIRRSNNYATLVENGVDFSSIKERAEPKALSDIASLDQDQKDTLREGLVSVAGYQSTQDQIEAYKVGAEQSSSSFDETAEYVQNYNESVAELRRDQALNTYIEYNNYLVG